MNEPVPDYMRFWGKAQPRDAQSAAWHPLVWHSLDVAAVAEAMIEHDGIARDLALRAHADVHAAGQFVVCLTALHDLGKFSLGFQAKAPGCFPTSVLELPATPKIGDHPSIGQRMLGEPDFASLWDRLAPNLGDTPRQILAGAIAGHHGRPATPLNNWPVNEIGQKAVAAASAFCADVVELLSLQSFTGQIEERSARAFSWRLAGFVNLADWIGSNQQIFRYEPPDIAMDDYWRQIARPRARQAVAAACVSPNAISLASGFKALTRRSEQPSPLQSYCETIDGLGDGPSFFLIEDMTGAGKTEAALILAHRLMQAGTASGIFVALPTQATANAMYARLGHLYRRLFDETARPSLALSHGGARLHDGFQDSILDVGAFEAAGVKADDDITASAACAAWIGSDRRRSVFADVGVGTIDQTFLSVLPVKFAALRMLGLSSKILILDEIHAYGAYEAEELLRLVEFHAARGGSIIALSATLPQVIKDRLIRAWRLGLRVKGEAVNWLPNYPVATRIDGAGRVSQCPVDPREGLPRTVQVDRLADTEAVLDAIASAVALGASVAWIRNTVDDVLAGAAELAERGIAATIFHARFAMCDRQKIEAEVIKAFGPTSTPEERRGRVVVASQVIEQSIDVDFDLMISDLAPIDLLIQRAGRLWRHARDKRPLAEARLLVVSPDPDGQIEADWLSRQLRGTSYVYGNHALMWQTAKVLFAAGAIVSPEDIRRLVEEVYATHALDMAPGALQRSRFEAEGEASADRAYAGMNLLKIGIGYSANSDDVWNPEVHTPTRTGQERTIFRLARWDGAALMPWAGAVEAVMNPREIERLWALSEVAVSRRRATGRGDYPPEVENAAKRLEAEWGETGACVVLPLVEKGGRFWSFAAKGTQSNSVCYQRSVGLIFAEVR